jgi:hypothetical protein
VANNKPSNTTVVDKCTQRLNAFAKYVDPNETVYIEGVLHTAGHVVALFQSCLDDRAAVATAKAEVKVRMAKRAAGEKARRAADRALKPWVVSRFGTGSKEALDFGFAPAKATARSPEDKAKAVKQAAATREARHTMGPKAKLKIRGVLPQETAAVVPSHGEPA